MSGHTTSGRIDGSSSSATGCVSRDLRTMPTVGGWPRDWRRASPSRVALLLDLVAPVRNAARNHGVWHSSRGERRRRRSSTSWPTQRRPTASWNVASRWTPNGSCEATTPAPPRSRPLLPSRNNHDRFATVARGNPQLEAALPLSADIAALTEFGLDALAAIESERAPAMVRVVSANHR